MKFDLFVIVPAIREENDGLLYVCTHRNDSFLPLCNNTIILYLLHVHIHVHVSTCQ